MYTVTTVGSLLSQLLWAEDPATRALVSGIALLGLIAFVTVHGSLLLRWLRLDSLRRAIDRLYATVERGRDPSLQRVRRLEQLFEDSALADTWRELKRRRSGFGAADPTQRAPVRMLDLLEEAPLLPWGLRRALLPALPGAFLALGLFGTFAGIALAAPDLLRGEDPARAAALIGLALRSALWGLALSIVATLATRLLESGFAQLSVRIDALVEHALPSIGALEHAAIEQREGLDLLGQRLERVTSDVTGALDSGLERIEDSLASSASLVTDAQRKSVQTLVEDLATSVQRGVDEHLGQLQAALQRAVEHQGAVTGGLEATFERMRADAATHAQVTAGLDEATKSVTNAAEAMSASARELAPVAERIGEASGSIERAASHVEAAQSRAASSVEDAAPALSEAAVAVREQREFVSESLDEIRALLDAFNRGLGDNLGQALQSIDSALGSELSRLRDALRDTDETISRIAEPVRSAEMTNREMHAALERVRTDVASFSEWLVQTVEPVRTTLGQLDETTGSISRSLASFGGRADTVEKALDALRANVTEESRALRRATEQLAAQLARGIPAGGDAAARSATAGGPDSGSAGGTLAGARVPTLDLGLRENPSVHAVSLERAPVSESSAALPLALGSTEPREASAPSDPPPATPLAAAPSPSARTEAPPAADASHGPAAPPRSSRWRRAQPSQETRAAGDPASADDDARGGYSALLSRYKAPQFSIQDLPDELRSGLPEAPTPAARDGGREDGRELAGSPASEPRARAAEAPPRDAEAAAGEPGDSGEPGDVRRRRRLQQFFGRD